MNLEESIKWIKGQINQLENEMAPSGQINTYKKFKSWMCELLRYRLFLSEIYNEIELSEKKMFTKKDMINLLTEEIDDWELHGQDIIE